MVSRNLLLGGGADPLAEKGTFGEAFARGRYTLYSPMRRNSVASCSLFVPCTRRSGGCDADEGDCRRDLITYWETRTRQVLARPGHAARQRSNSQSSGACFGSTNRRCLPWTHVIYTGHREVTLTSTIPGVVTWTKIQQH